MFQPGDYVHPTDLPVWLLCRVTQVESLNPGGEGFQVLTLTPLEGPWKAGARLVRFAEGVRPARRGCYTSNSASCVGATTFVSAARFPTSARICASFASMIVSLWSGS
jgi:hypothetical protein